MNTFNIIRHYNSPNMGEYRGMIVRRQEKIFVPEYGGFIMCVPDSEHFIFEVPVHMKDSAFRCTCGSVAVITGYGAYAPSGSPSSTGGLMLVCLNHTTFGQHATGGSRWI